MKWILSICLLLMSAWVQAAPPARIVTIGGAVTEIVYALDAGDLIVGNDTTSYYPAAAEKKPKVGYMRMLSAEGVLSLNPELIITTDEAGPPTVIQQIEAAGVNIVKLKAGRSVSDVKDMVRHIAKILSRQEQADQLLNKIDHQQKQLHAGIGQQTEVKKVMFVLQHGNGSPMVAGKNTAADIVIRLSGAENAVSAYAGYKPLTPEAAVAIAPDVILMTTMGLEQAGGKTVLLNSPGIALTPAAKKGHLIAMDALMLIGFGPRTVEAAAALNKAYSAL